MSSGTLAVTYTLAGELDHLRVPAPRTPRMADELWRHTCCEIFITRKGAPEFYYEFNFSPSGEWAIYAFERYREPVSFDKHHAQSLSPQIIVRDADDKLRLDASIPLDRLSPLYVRGALSVAVSVVAEDQDGLLSYWALKHPPGKPDFHHPDAFALELE